MGTKNQPSEFDCYAAAEPDEPMFVLLGRDKFAAQLVALWADAREMAGEDPAKVAEARTASAQMRAWCHTHGRQPMKIKWPSGLPDRVGSDDGVVGD